MHNKVYFSESKPGVYLLKKHTRFKLKTNFQAKIQYRENLSNKEKTALRNLIKAKVMM